MSSSFGLPHARCRALALLLAAAVPCSILTPSRLLRAEDNTPGTFIDFDRQVRPILAENCFTCHGPDEQQRKAKLRLDQRESTLAAEGVIVPGDGASSTLIERITAEDPEERMPPPRTGKRLSPEQARVLQQWIDQGAKWSTHWSFRPLTRPALPSINASRRSRNAVDGFILARLEAEKLGPSPEADRATLIRRVTLDLTGLPPRVADVDAFLADKDPEAYEHLVDRLLASPRYGERLALDWLDAARFADTHGYHRDGGRDMTRWRDGVINAFNKNQPFDQFTIEQLAGDLLPGASLSQRIASGFNRNHMINIETGAVPEEYHTAYVVDRVNTTGTVWLGLTLGCAQCHDHKFDPIRQKEYFGIFAFFNNLPENGIDGAKGNAAPFVKLPTTEQQAELDRLAAAVRNSPMGQMDELAKRTQALAAFEATVPTAMVMAEMPEPRDTAVLMRGQYDHRGERVSPGVPSSLPPLPPNAPANRLGLARWLVSPDHPLTARVTVNRYWQMVFGTGLVKTAEDFGTQGEYPSHPELLDWLASEFITSGWDVKLLLRTLVTSATYRQSSVVTPEVLRRDPENRLLARAPRVRLQGEFLRDQALAASGLLDGRIGGASVFPYQPAGLWEELCARLDSANFSAQTYTPSRGADLYRRTMYTFWKRTSPPPGLSTLDAPDRETCTVRRARTNTPLQALVLLNDPTYVEAARRLAERGMADASGPEERLIFLFRHVLSRTPLPSEQSLLLDVFHNERRVFGRDRERATRLLRVGESLSNSGCDPAALAAWTVVASMILNLDEAITKG